MVQSFFSNSRLARDTFTRSYELKRLPQKERKLGVELALPLTILVLILFSEQSPMLKMQIDEIVDWLCAHDMVASAIELGIGCIPLWMLAVIIYDKVKASKN